MSNTFLAPFWLPNGLLMTLYTARQANQLGESQISFQDCLFSGAEGVPLFGRVAIPDAPQGTIISTYGITGSLDNQGLLTLLAQKAFAAHYAVVVFDWRAHGRTAQLSPTLTSDGLYEGEDFIRIAAAAKQLGCPAPFWLTSYSLGGQLALWGIKAAQTLTQWGSDLALEETEIGGAAVICPNLDSNRSLTYLMEHPIGKYLEKAIAVELQKLAWQLHQFHGEAIASESIKQANSIRGFDRQLVIERLGFTTVEEYYSASSPLPLLPHLQKPTLIIYAADDPLFDPSLVPELQDACINNPAITLMLTQQGGHVGYFNSLKGQGLAGDSDRWWALNRVLEWIKNEGRRNKEI